MVTGASNPPSGLAAAVAGAHQINLSWTNNSSNQTGFKVYQATNYAFTQNLTTVTVGANATSYQATGLTIGTTYYYQVQPLAAIGNGGYSNTASGVISQLTVNGTQGSSGQNDQIYLVRDTTNPALLDVYLNNSNTAGYTATFAGLTNVIINGLGGVNVNALTLDLSNGPVVPSGGITYTGNTSLNGDSLVVVGSSGNDTVTFAANQVTIGSGIVTTTGVPVQNLSFKGGAGNDSLTLNGGSYAFTTDVSLNTTHLSLSLQSGAQVSFSGIQHLAGLSLAGASAVTLADGGQSAIVVQSLSIDATSKLDLADDGLIVNYSGSDPFSSIYALVSASAHNGWVGVGIVSHSAAANSQRALGIADNASLGLATFAGQSVGSTSVLIRYTYLGDANLDGRVDVSDLGTVGSNWQKAGRVWSQGDFNYDNVVNVTDLGDVGSNWQKTVIALSAPSPSPADASASSAAPSVAAAAAAEAAAPAAEVALTSVSDELTNTADAVTTPMEDQATAVPTAVSGAGTWPITAPPAVDAEGTVAYIPGTEDVIPADTSVMMGPIHAITVSYSGGASFSTGSADLVHTGMTSLTDHITATPRGSRPALPDERLTSIVAAAEQRWAAAGGSVLTAMAGVSGQGADLRVGRLGEASGGIIPTAPDAVGRGWFAEPTSAVDEAFAPIRSNQQLWTNDPRAVDRIDLLTVVECELRHVAGLGDLDTVPDDLISCVLGEAS